MIPGLWLQSNQLNYFVIYYLLIIFVGCMSDCFSDHLAVWSEVCICSICIFSVMRKLGFLIVCFIVYFF